MSSRLFVTLVGTVVATGISPAAQAAYLGVGVQLHSTVVVDGAPRSVYRVYAIFDVPDDGAIAAGSVGAGSPVILESLNSTGTGPGSDFLDSISGAPGDFAGSNVCNAMIGALTYTPDPLFVSGNSYSNPSVSWSTSTPFALAGNGVAGSFWNGNTVLNGMGVAILQLTVNDGDNISGAISVVGNHFVNDVFGTFVATNQTFTSYVPAPAAGWLVGLTAMRLTRSKGRRRQ